MLRIENLDFGEKISWDTEPLVYIIRASFSPSQTTFLTPPEFKQQAGFVVYPKGGVIKRHIHRDLERQMVGTSEVLIVQKGCCEIDIYNDGKELVATRELNSGDVILMINGGHGFRMLENTVLFEIKQGPYLDVDEKECF